MNGSEDLLMVTRLLDSVILIDHFNNVSQATRFLRGLDPADTCISVISRAEILVGFREESADTAKLLLDQYGLLNIDKAVADRAAELRRSQGWKLPDAFQAALALHHGVMLSTRNTKDFDPKKHSFVEIPYML